MLLLLLMLAGSCAPVHAPEPPQKTYWLPWQVRDTDKFCLEPRDAEERWPIRCWSVGELRMQMGSLKTN